MIELLICEVSNSYKIDFHEDADQVNRFLPPPCALLPSAPVSAGFSSLGRVHVGVLPSGGAAIYSAISTKGVVAWSRWI